MEETQGLAFLIICLNKTVICSITTFKTAKYRGDELKWSAKEATEVRLDTAPFSGHPETDTVLQRKMSI